MMSALPYRAVIVDLDRTLLRTDKSVSDFTLSVLREWQSRGAKLLAASARPERDLELFRLRFGFEAMTALNGAVTLTPGGRFEAPLSPASAAAVLHNALGLDGAVVSVETGGGYFANVPIPEWEPIVLSDLTDLPQRERIFKILASHPERTLSPSALTLPEDAYCTAAKGTLLQVMSREATKWNGVQRMLSCFGIDPREAIYFGDDEDDLEPICLCGCGVAVANALPSVRAAADAVTDSHDQDGVARYLYRLLHPAPHPLLGSPSGGAVCPKEKASEKPSGFLERGGATERCRR